MNILILSHMYPSTVNSIKGIFVHQQNVELRKRGCQTNVVVPRPWAPFPLSKLRPRWNRYSLIADRYHIDGIDVLSPPYLAFPGGVRIDSAGWKIFKAMRSTGIQIESYDLVHAHTALPDGQAGILIKKKFGLPLVVTVHGKDVQQTVHRNRRCRKAIAEVIVGADRVVAVSWKIKRLVDELSGVPEKTVVVNNGFDSSVFNIHKPEVYSKCIVSVSNLIKTKGIDLNIKAIAMLRNKHPELRYIVVGGGKEYNNLFSLACSLGVDDIVSFFGKIKNVQVPKYLADAQIFSLPSFMEGFGVSYLEAMASGLVIVGCIGEGIEDVIKNGETGFLVEPNNLNDLVRTLDFLLSNPKHARDIGQKGRNLALSKFTWNENAKKIINLYMDIIAL